MLKAAIEKIVELAGASYHETPDGHIYTDGNVTEVRPKLDLPELLRLTSLDALIQFVRKEAVHITEESEPLFLTVSSHEDVFCYTAIEPYNRNRRTTLYHVTATDVPGWDSETKLPFEQASIALQTRFQETEDRNYTLRLLSQITSGGKVTYNDNGIATSVITQKGVALQGSEVIRPLVKLKPYRTFQEVEQPEGLFLIRVDERGISFIEADGGMWKLRARQIVKEYLEKELGELVEKGKVSIAL